MEEDNILVTMSEIQDINDFMKDPDVEEALEMVIRAAAISRLPEPAKAAGAVVKLQALSAKFAIQATMYTTIKKDRPGSEAHHKKNIYYTLAEQTDKLAAAMKIVARINQM